MTHVERRSRMFWKIQGDSVPLSKISTEIHLNNIKNTLTKNKGFWNGYPSDKWIKAIDTELEYRKALGKQVMQLLSTNNCIILKAKPV